MNQKTYEALKRIIKGVKKDTISPEESFVSFNDINTVEDWIIKESKKNKTKGKK